MVGSLSRIGSSHQWTSRRFKENSMAITTTEQAEYFKELARKKDKLWEALATRPELAGIRVRLEKHLGFDIKE